MGSAETDSCSALTNIFSFLVAEVTPHAFASIGWRYYIVFACTNLFMILPCKMGTR